MSGRARPAGTRVDPRPTLFGCRGRAHTCPDDHCASRRPAARTRRRHAVLIAAALASTAHLLPAQRDSVKVSVPQASVEELTPAVQVALATVPWDSICGGVGCVVVQVDPELRRIRYRTEISEISSKLGRIADDTVAAWGTTKQTFRAASFSYMSSQRDTVRVVVGVRESIAPDQLGISMLIRLPRHFFDDLAILDLERRSGRWRVLKALFIEG
jgi:hypothetical protein